MRQAVGGRRADHLAAVVDSGSPTGGATRESAEVDHFPVFEQESMRIPARGGREADHLAAVVNAGRAAGCATGESAEIVHYPVIEQKCVQIPTSGVRFADHLAIRDKVGHLETLPIDLLYAHLDASFIFNHLDTMNGGPNFSYVIAPSKKAGL